MTTNFNLPLKLRIISKYGSQWKFAAAAGVHESEVSKVMRYAKDLSDEKKRVWARVLKCRVEEIFS